MKSPNPLPAPVEGAVSAEPTSAVPASTRRAQNLKRGLAAGVLGSLLVHGALLLSYRLFNAPSQTPPNNLIEIDLSNPDRPKPEVQPTAPPPVPPKVVVHRVSPKSKSQPPKRLAALPKVVPPPPPKPRVVPPPKPRRVVLPIEKPKPQVQPKTQPQVPPKPQVQPKTLPQSVAPKPQVSKPVPSKVVQPKAVQPKVVPPPSVPAPPSASRRRMALPSSQPRRETHERLAGLPRSSQPLSSPSRDQGRSRPQRAPSDNPFSASPKTSQPGGQGSATPEPLPQGERFGRLNAGDPGNVNDRPSGSFRTGGGLPNAGQSTGGSPRGRNPELAGSEGGGGARSTTRLARQGGGGRTSDNVFTYNDPTHRDPNRIAASPGAGPGAGGGQGGGSGGGAGRQHGSGGNSGGDSGDRFAFQRSGPGVGGESGPLAGGGPGHGRSGGGEIAGDGGNGGGRGGGTGGGLGRERGRPGRGDGGSGGTGRGTRLAGVPFGDPNGVAGGNPRGGGGKGGGPGGTGSGPGSSGGRGTRLARRDDGDGSGGGKGFGRGHGGDGLGDSGSGGRGKGDGGDDGNGRGNRGDEGAGGGRAGRRRIAAATGRLEREHESESIVGRGIWSPGLVGRYYQDPDKGDLQPGHPIDWPTLGEGASDFKTTHVSETIDFNWGTDAPRPGMRGTYWSVRWTGRIFVPKDDEYRFFLNDVDDGGRLKLDGNTIIDVWKVQKSSPGSGKMTLKKGPHDIVLEYAQGPATASSIRLMWESSSFPRELVGSYKG